MIKRIKRIQKIQFIFQVTEEELHNLKKNLPWYCKFIGGIKFMDELPHTSTRKIDKKQLKLLATSYSS